MVTIQINLVKILGCASSVLAMVCGAILVVDRLKKMKLTVTVIIMALLGIITTMWLIGIKMPPETSEFMWCVALLVTHFIAFTMAMTALNEKCNKAN